MRNKEYTIGPFPLSVKPTLIDWGVVVIPPIVIIICAIHFIMEYHAMRLNEIYSMRDCFEYLLLTFGPLAVASICYWGHMSRYLSRYTILEEGVRIKTPFRKKKLLRWEEIQEVCIQYGNKTKAGGYQILICIVEKGVKKNSATGKWSALGIFNYRSVLSMQYRRKAYGKIQELCPLQIVTPLDFSPEMKGKPENTKDDAQTGNRKAIILRGCSLSNFFGYLFTAAFMASILVVPFVLGFRFDNAVRVFQYLIVVGLICMCIYSGLGYFRTYTLTDEEIILKNNFGKIKKWKYSEITRIIETSIGYKCYCKGRFLFMFENEQILKELKKRLPADTDYIFRKD